MQIWNPMPKLHKKMMQKILIMIFCLKFVREEFSWIFFYLRIDELI